MEPTTIWLTESIIYYLVLISLIFDFLLDLYISYRQNKVLSDARYEDLPRELKTYYSYELFERARKNEICSNKFEVCWTISRLVKNATYLYFLYYAVMWKYSKIMLSSTGLWPSNWDEELGITLCYYLMATVFTELTNFPFYLYQKYAEDSRDFGMGILLPSLKHLALRLIKSTLVYGPGAAFTVLIVKYTGTYFFYLVFCYRFLADVSISYLYPSVIHPILNDFTRLKESALRKRLQKLVDEVGFPLSEIYIRTSNSSDQANAYFDGVFTNKRIVLLDSLIKDLDNDNLSNKSAGENIEEIAATVAHELGHWNGLHPIKMFLCNQLKNIFLVVIFVALYQHGPMFQVFGFRKEERPVWIAYEISQDYILILYHLMTNVLDSLWSRNFEREADNYAVKKGFGATLKSGICKDHAENLNFPFEDHLYQFCNGSHPTLQERIANIDLGMKKAL